MPGSINGGYPAGGPHEGAASIILITDESMNDMMTVPGVVDPLVRTFITNHATTYLAPS